MLKRTTLFLLLVFALSSFLVYAAPPQYLEITFVTTNDLHGRALPFDIAPDPARNYAGEKSVGGYARIATVIRRVREETRTPLMLLDSGDTTYGGPLYRTYHGLSDIAVLNALDYDAMVPGNHEFQMAGKYVVANHAASQFPWVCANIVEAKTGKPFFVPYVIYELDGVRVAVFGLCNNLVETQPKAYIAGPELGLKALSAPETAQKLMPELRKQADIVVLLSHLGRTADVQLVQKVPGIDIVLGGHSHSRLGTPQMVQVGQREAFSLGAVPIVQAGYWGRDVGRTRLIFRRDEHTGRYTLMSCKGELIPIDASIPDDPGVAGIIRDFQKRIPPPSSTAAPSSSSPEPAK